MGSLDGDTTDTIHVANIFQTGYIVSIYLPKKNNQIK